MPVDLCAHNFTTEVSLTYLKPQATKKKTRFTQLPMQCIESKLKSVTFFFKECEMKINALS